MKKTTAVYIKMVNEIEDFLEYRYKGYNRDGIKTVIMKIIDRHVETLKGEKQ